MPVLSPPATSSKQRKNSSRRLPKSWFQAAGLLKYKTIDPVSYQRKIRLEWEKRLRQLEQHS